MNRDAEQSPAQHEGVLTKPILLARKQTDRMKAACSSPTGGNEDLLVPVAALESSINWKRRLDHSFDALRERVEANTVSEPPRASPNETTRGYARLTFRAR
jgi:hypothetical protein